jgi:hypothetical protein
VAGAEVVENSCICFRAAKEFLYLFSDGRSIPVSVFRRSKNSCICFRTVKEFLTDKDRWWLFKSSPPSEIEFSFHSSYLFLYRTSIFQLR